MEEDNKGFGLSKETMEGVERIAHKKEMEDKYPFNVTVSGDVDSAVCILFSGDGFTKRFWQLTCPCGVTDAFPLNELPEVDTLQSCGNPKHWAVKFEIS